jgi:hypothetical protein
LWVQDPVLFPLFGTCVHKNVSIAERFMVVGWHVIRSVRLKG